MMSMGEEPPFLFIEDTPLGFTVRTTEDYWKLISEVKHPVVAHHLENVREALRQPDQVRQSQSDSLVYLFYRKLAEERWLCAVAKRLDGEGFLVTAYLTDTVKEGKMIWPR